jgi:hypothetical protein
MVHFHNLIRRGATLKSTSEGLVGTYVYIYCIFICCDVGSHASFKAQRRRRLCIYKKNAVW